MTRHRDDRHRFASISARATVLLRRQGQQAAGARRPGETLADAATRLEREAA